MKVDVAGVRKALKTFDFNTLFYEYLGWDKHQAHLDIPVNGKNRQCDFMHECVTVTQSGNGEP
jgi:hypothetical protein